MLHVLGRLANGYHRLQSLIIFVDVGDKLDITPHNSDSLTLTGQFAPLLKKEEENSIFKAKRFFYDYFKLLPQFFTIHLEKKLPIAAGIGGGTSDAAAMLALLLDFHGIKLKLQEQHDFICASGCLGADVPVCLSFQLGLGVLFWLDGSGVEELPQSIPLSQPLYLVLVNPGVLIHTNLIFKNLKSPFTPFLTLPSLKVTQDILTFLKRTKNDLELPARRAYQLPDLSAFKGRGDLIRQSGSGATSFILIGTAAKAKDLKNWIQSENSSWWVEVTESLLPIVPLL